MTWNNCRPDAKISLKKLIEGYWLNWLKKISPFEYLSIIWYRPIIFNNIKETRIVGGSTLF